MVISNDFCRQRNDRYLPEMCSISSGIGASELARDVLPWIFRDQRYPMCAWGYNNGFQCFSSKTKHGPVESNVLSCLFIISMKGKTLDQHTHTPCVLVKRFTTPQVQKVLVPRVVTQALGQCGEQQNLEVYLWKQSETSGFRYFNPWKRFISLDLRVCVCVLCILMLTV